MNNESGGRAPTGIFLVFIVHHSAFIVFFIEGARIHMKRFTVRVRTAGAALLVAAAAVAPAFGQEDTQRLVEEVAARVNADVITRSQYLDALRDTEADFKANLS